MYGRHATYRLKNNNYYKQSDEVFFVCLFLPAQHIDLHDCHHLNPPGTGLSSTAVKLQPMVFAGILLQCCDAFGFPFILIVIPNALCHPLVSFAHIYCMCKRYCICIFLFYLDFLY